MNDTDFIGEIRYFCFNYVPEGWLQCDGAELNIHQYTVLFAVIGTAYGGNGTSNFKLPDLRGRAGIAATERHAPPYRRGGVLGHDTVTLTLAHLPPHTHQMVRPGGGKPYAQKLDTPSSVSAPGSLALADGTVVKALTNTGAPNAALSAAAVTTVGSGLPHSNLQPYQVFTAGICFDGVFPPRP